MSRITPSIVVRACSNRMNGACRTQYYIDRPFERGAMECWPCALCEFGGPPTIPELSASANNFARIQTLHMGNRVTRAEGGHFIGNRRSRFVCATQALESKVVRKWAKVNRA